MKRPVPKAIQMARNLLMEGMLPEGFLEDKKLRGSLVEIELVVQYGSDIHRFKVKAK